MEALPDGTSRRVNLRVNMQSDPTKPLKWQRPASGTNIIESYHSQAHQLFVHSGGNLSPAHMQAVLLQHAWRWNLGIMVRCGLASQSCLALCMDPILACRLNDTCSQLGLPKPYDGLDWPAPPASDEAFGFDW